MWIRRDRKADNEDLPSEINEQLARRKVTFRNKFALGSLNHLLIYLQIPLPLFSYHSPTIFIFGHKRAD